MTIIIKTGPRVSGATASKVRAMLEECRAAAWNNPDWQEWLNHCSPKPLAVKLRNNGYRSNAGAREMMLDVKCLQGNNRIMFEYKSYEQQPDIGGFYHDNPELVFKALVAHEYSHHLQYGYYRAWQWSKHKPGQSLGRPPAMQPHGKVFRMIYGHLRQQLINQHGITPFNRKHGKDDLQRLAPSVYTLRSKQPTKETTVSEIMAGIKTNPAKPAHIVATFIADDAKIAAGPAQPDLPMTGQQLELF